MTARIFTEMEQVLFPYSWNRLMRTEELHLRAFGFWVFLLFWGKGHLFIMNRNASRNVLGWLLTLMGPCVLWVVHWSVYMRQRCYQEVINQDLQTLSLTWHRNSFLNTCCLWLDPLHRETQGIMDCMIPSPAWSLRQGQLVAMRMQVLPEARSFTGCVNSLYSESKVGRNVRFNWPFSS